MEILDPFADDDAPPHAPEIPSPERYIDATFGENGYLARAFTGYAPRQIQIDMARAVDRSIVAGRHLLAEAGTGTGKSVALLVPATYHAAREGKQVVVVTANLALQAQYIEKDLPTLARILPWKFTFDTMKGRNNYLCVDRYEQFDLERRANRIDVDEEGRRQLPVVTGWAEASIRAIDRAGSPAIGDLAELPFEVSPSLRRRVSVQSDECKRNRCRHRHKCFPNRANERARAAHVVVTNYAMLFAHLSVFQEIGSDVVLPPFHYLIMDECFPAGTMVDGKPIEDIHPGNTVRSFDESTGSFVDRTVKQTFQRRPNALVRLHTDRGTVVCTPGHPFLTKNGWLPAVACTGEWVSIDGKNIHDELSCMRRGCLRSVQEDDALCSAWSGLLLARACIQVSNGTDPSFPHDQTCPDGDAVLCVRGTSRYRPQERIREGVEDQEIWSCILLGGAQTRIYDQAVARNATNHYEYDVQHLRKIVFRERYGDVESQESDEGWTTGTLFHSMLAGDIESCDERADEWMLRADIHAHENQKSNARPSHKDQGEEYPYRDGSQSDQARWERSNNTNSASYTCESIGLAVRGCRSCRSQSNEGASDALQDRYRQRGIAGCSRSGRAIPLHVDRQGARCQEGRVASWSRVDRVEVLQPGSDGTYGGMCPDGFVYNIEVDGTQTYVADGFVVHNCHAAPDRARSHFGFSVREDQIRRIARLVRTTDPHAADACERATTQIFHVFGEVRRDRERYKARIDVGKFRPEEIESWRRAIEALEAVAKVLVRRREEKQAALRVARGGPEEEDAEDALATAEQHAERANALLTQLRTPYDDGIFDTGDVPDYVHFLEEDEKRRITLSCLLLRPADVLSSLLFEKHAVVTEKDSGPVDLGHVTIVGASATLTTEGGNFAFSRAELGVYDRCDVFLGASPFDWPNQALFVLPNDLPDPNDRTFRDAVAAVVERVVLLVGGRTLGLFTSRRSLEHTHDKIWPTCRREGYTLLRQGDEPRPILLRKFREDVTSVLLGTESFWAGVDVQGEACSAVVIDRLPFPTPDDPILDALSEVDRSAFFKYAVPKAILSFRQAAGRLIRTTTDRGVIVCCDRRIAEKRYGSLFLRALPNIPKTRDLSSIVDWLRPPNDPETERWDAL